MSESAVCITLPLFECLSKAKLRHNSPVFHLTTYTMTRTDETWQRLLNWTQSSTVANHLAAQVLQDQGFTLLPANHPLAGADTGTDGLYVRDGQRWLKIIYFVQEQQSFEQIRDQFAVQLATIAKHTANGILFVTNQELSRNERVTLKQSCDFPLLEVFDLDRISTILDSPRLAQIRQQSLYAETIPLVPPVVADDPHQRAAALEKIQQDVIKFESLAHQDFALHGADLAKSLHDLSVKLYEQGNRTGALAVGQRVVTIFDQLLEQGITRSAPGLSKALQNLSIVLRDTGQSNAALTASQRALAIDEDLAQKDFSAHGADLASSLNNLANHLVHQGKADAAFAAIQRAITIRESLAQQDFARHGRDLAGSLINLSVQLGIQQDWQASLAASQRAVTIFENLAQQNFESYAEGLATSLNNLALCFQKLDDTNATLETGKRAVAIYESLAQHNFPVHGASLAMGLHNLATHYFKENQFDKGMTTIERAVAIREQLAHQYPERYEAELAASLFVFGQHTESPVAATVIARAIKLLEPHAKPGTQYAGWFKVMPVYWRRHIEGSTNLIQFKRLSLKNYRGFDQIDIDFQPDITVLVANNGQGKTTVLDACRIALWAYLSGFDLAHNGQEALFAIRPDDVHIKKISDTDWAHQFPASISILANYGPYTETNWAQSLDNAIPGTANRDDEGAVSLKAWARLLQDQVRNAQLPPLDLPVFAYYDTDRSWAQQRTRVMPDEVKLMDTNSDFYIRTYAYRNCIQSAASYAAFEEWFEWIFLSHRETQIKNKEAGLTENATSVWQDAIFVVQQAVDSLLRKITGWHTLEFSVSFDKSLILHNDQQMIMKVSQLSDGIRNILGMVGDLAFRCIKINPHLGKQAALEAHGVVLIDEIDMHLHPGWQQHVVGQLREAFPKIQFIITTHSHQVLSSVFARSIRRIHRTLEGEASHFEVEPIRFETRGVASSDVMADIMKIDEIPDVPEAKALSRYRALIQLGLYESEEGKLLAVQLDQHFGEDHPEMRDCARLIKLEEIKRKVEKARADKVATMAEVGNA